eukprot:Blabericola_migrator_1__5620@NODE_2859_length_2271_cov_57_398820_g1283_i1_p1_GENE_NODE_2859_length_2271_cov_57_398820_g1283_i1NODE_2859_length_2271_cov_57_398820_g1283_i1_p1_ORF_typecomplete_len302_score52_33_NODE_2859_length_2271_cov_57_398820_g1283_i111322037
MPDILTRHVAGERKLMNKFLQDGQTKDETISKETSEAGSSDSSVESIEETPQQNSLLRGRRPVLASRRFRTASDQPATDMPRQPPSTLTLDRMSESSQTFSPLRTPSHTPSRLSPAPRQTPSPRHTVPQEAGIPLTVAPSSETPIDPLAEGLDSPFSAMIESPQRQPQSHMHLIHALLKTPGSKLEPEEDTTQQPLRSMADTDPDFVRHFFRHSRLHLLGRWRDQIFRKFNFMKFDQIQIPLSESLTSSSSIAPWRPARILFADFDAFFVTVVMKKATHIPDIEKLPCHNRSVWPMALQPP